MIANKRLALVKYALLMLLFAWPGHAEDRPNVIVFFVDDLGYADLGCQGLADDIRTPNIDRLAAEGVRFTDGYVTAPQCGPSRAGLMTGRYQQRFGFDHIPDCPLPADQVTLADRMRALGYRTGQVGKWHLEPNVLSRDWAEQTLDNPQYADNGRLRTIPYADVRPYQANARGFDECFQGEMNTFWATYDLAGNDLADGGEHITLPGYRLDIQSDAACAFIDRNHDAPFFLYVAHYAPHVPLEAPEKYLDRFPGPMPERRRMCLAMMSAVDDGVGKVMAKLQEHGIDDNTLVIFTSDNGAPIKINKEDVPLAIPGGAWDGSINDPLNGEKGTLLEGGIRVPFVLWWKGRFGGTGLVSTKPVISLDIAATAIAVAGGQPDPELDGINLIPYLNSAADSAPGQLERDSSFDRPLYWRFWNQAAMRQGKWKYLELAGGHRYLFDLSSDLGETDNLIDRHPQRATQMRADLQTWLGELQPTGMPQGPLNDQEKLWFRAYLGLQP